MARILREEEYTAKRNEILDVALQLVYSKGYDKMTIQDILDQLKISKGAFYHYFNSKVDVLEAVVERMATEQVKPIFLSIVDDPPSPARIRNHCSLSASRGDFVPPAAASAVGSTTRNRLNKRVLMVIS